LWFSGIFTNCIPYGAKTRVTRLRVHPG